MAFYTWLISGIRGRRGSEGQPNCAVVAERLSSDHNVAVEEVRREVNELHPDDSHIVVYTRGVWRINGIIQVPNCSFFNFLWLVNQDCQSIHKTFVLVPRMNGSRNEIVSIYCYV